MNFFRCVFRSFAILNKIQVSDVTQYFAKQNKYERIQNAVKRRIHAFIQVCWCIHLKTLISSMCVYT